MERREGMCGIQVVSFYPAKVVMNSNTYSDVIMGCRGWRSECYREWEGGREREREREREEGREMLCALGSKDVVMCEDRNWPRLSPYRYGLNITHFQLCLSVYDSILVCVCRCRAYACVSHMTASPVFCLVHLFTTAS